MLPLQNLGGRPKRTSTGLTLNPVAEDTVLHHNRYRFKIRRQGLNVLEQSGQNDSQSATRVVSSNPWTPSTPGPLPSSLLHGNFSKYPPRSSSHELNILHTRHIQNDGVDRITLTTKDDDAQNVPGQPNHLRWM